MIKLFALAIIALSLNYSPQPATLTEAEMKGAIGGDGCYNCHSVQLRQDECYHNGSIDSCQTSKCIANYCTEGTCDLGSGTCTALSSADNSWDYQYIRQDSGCSNSYSGLPVVWFTHYYGASCTSFSGKVRCQKIGSCDGTLITTASKQPGIYCP
jgi:hypothetical protein